MASSFAPKCANGMARPLGFVCSGQVWLVEWWWRLILPFAPCHFPGRWLTKRLFLQQIYNTAAATQEEFIFRFIGTAFWPANVAASNGKNARGIFVRPKKKVLQGPFGCASPTQPSRIVGTQRSAFGQPICGQKVVNAKNAGMKKGPPTKGQWECVAG